MWIFIYPDLNIPSIFKYFIRDIIFKNLSWFFGEKHELPFQNKKNKFIEKPERSVQLRNLITKNILFIFLIFLMFWFAVYEHMKKIESTWQWSRMLDFCTYPIFLKFIEKVIEKENKDYFYDENNKYSCSKLLRIHYRLIFFFMAIYDYQRPRYFVNQSLPQQYLIRIIYLLLFFHILWLFSNKTRSRNKMIEKKSRNNYNPDDLFINIKIPILVYLFFLSDEMDRLILIFIAIPYVIFFFFFYSFLLIV